MKVEAESENRDGEVGYIAVPPVPSDAPVSRAHYKLWEVAMEGTQILLYLRVTISLLHR